jgi:hypothetical protein
MRRAYYADHNCPGYTSVTLSFETLGHLGAGTMQFLAQATNAAFRDADYRRSLTFANFYHQLSAVSCRYTFRMLSGAAGLHTASTGSSWLRGSLKPTPDVSN